MSHTPFEIFRANPETLVELMDFAAITARTITRENLEFMVKGDVDCIEAIIHVQCDDLEHGQRIVDSMAYAFATHDVDITIVGTTGVRIAWEIMQP